MSYKYPLATMTWDDAEYQAIQDVIKTGFFTMGPKVAEFEQKFADYAGSRYAVMVNSGSSANLAMVAALFYTQDPSKRLAPGDEVIVPAVSWATTYFPLHQYGLKQVIVDIDLDTLNYNLDSLAAAITDKTRAVMVVNLLGNPNDFTAIQKIIGNRNIVMIEDNCESMGAEFQGRKAGTFGVMGSFSSFFSHHIATMEGGLVVTDDEELYHILLSLRAHGWTRNLPKVNRITGTKSDDPFKESFRFVLPGYNLRPLEMSGAIGVHQVAKLPHMIAERRKNGCLLQEKLSNHPLFMIQKEIGASSWFGFSLILRPGVDMDRQEFLRRLGERGFETRPIVAGNFARTEVVKLMNCEIFGDLANADYLDANGLFIGNHHYSVAEAITELASL